MAKDLLRIHCDEVVNRTWNHAGRCETLDDDVFNAVLGLAGEVGEVVDIHKKAYFHKYKDRSEELKLELGDVCYYLAKIFDLYDLDMAEILEMNKKKLFERYELDGR